MPEKHKRSTGRNSNPDIDDADLRGGEAAHDEKRTKERWDSVHNVPARDKEAEKK